MSAMGLLHLGSVLCYLGVQPVAVQFKVQRQKGKTMAVTVSQSFLLGRFGQTFVVPTELLAKHEGEPYLKLIGSHRMLVKIVCGGHRGETMVKNASLADADQLKTMKTMVREAIHASQPEDKKEELFRQKGKKSKTVAKMPDTVTITLEGTHVDVKVPGEKEALAVRMQPDMLQATFEFLAQDCDKCFTSGSSAKRSYQRTGKFAGCASRKKQKTTASHAGSDSAAE